ncbi:hypothetical protein GCM10009798_05060 [Nocardioides panacihumi]|uniref:Zinc-ribbon domain-containing protein n=1 Tax=Nocardioides panacihumi TaxID=400774 RepID=A0ABP5BNU1_9ACTN
MSTPGNTKPYRRRTRPQLPPETLHWPTFVVTAPHSVPAPRGSQYARQPFGTWHGRTVGSHQTLCGRLAMTWTYFWTLDFQRTNRKLACPECARIAGLEV